MKLSRKIGRFSLDRAVIALFLAGTVVLSGRVWLAEHPEHSPWAPLELDHPVGWATQQKIAQMRDDPAECRAVLERGDVAFTALEPTGEGECRRDDRMVLGSTSLAPDTPQMSCPVATGFELWKRHGLEAAAIEIMGSPIARIEHLGTYSCRRMYGAQTGRWSEHATGNAIDIAAFTFEDGRRVSVLAGWNGEEDEAAFLRAARDAACAMFGTVLSPDYNDAHADHLHLDQASRGFGGVCR